MRKKALSKGTNLAPSPLDDEIKKSTLAGLKGKWTARTKRRRDLKITVDQRIKELADYKKEKNVLQRREGEVWKCGDTYKMEWTHSP